MERGREPPAQAVRTDRILAAASELLLRFRYKRVTIEELFGELVLREVAEVTRGGTCRGRPAGLGTSGEPDPDTLRAIAPRAIELFDRMCVERDPATATPAQQPREQ
jgi:hypothetical protein